MCVVMSQYQYVLKKDMGYNPKQIAIGNAYWDNEATRDAAYQFFKGLPYVEAVSSANSTPISGYSGSMIHSERAGTFLLPFFLFHARGLSCFDGHDYEDGTYGAR